MSKFLRWLPLAALFLVVVGWVAWPAPSNPEWDRITRQPPADYEPSPNLAEEPICELSKLTAGYNHYPVQQLSEGKHRQVLADFARHYEALHQQLRTDHFWPSRRELSALCAYAELLEANHEPIKAQAVAIDALRLSNKIRSNTSVMIGLRWRTRPPALSVIELMLARTRWSQQNLSQLSILLRESELPADLQIQDLKEQMRRVERGWIHPSPAEYLRLPFGLAHHKRIYQTQSLQLLKQLESGERLQLSEPALYRSHSVWREQLDPCLEDQAGEQRILAFTRIRQRLDLSWVEALRTGTPLEKLGEPLEAWLQPQVQNIGSGCWVLEGDRMQLAPWCNPNKF
ncbi:hypothetical protein JST97_33460 [bacterium]|nr:hypothetical protein [bacterium]